MKPRYYEIYTNKHKWFNPAKYEGMIIVINETDDTIINSWCNKKMGQKYQVVKGRGMIQVWNWMLVENVDEKVITTIQRKG